MENGVLEARATEEEPSCLTALTRGNATRPPMPPPQTDANVSRAPLAKKSDPGHCAHRPSMNARSCLDIP